MRDAATANVITRCSVLKLSQLSEIMNMGPNALLALLSGLVDTMIPGAGVRSALNDVLIHS